MTERQGPIACELTKLAPEIREGLAADLRLLLTTVQEVRPIEQGFALRWPPPEGPGLLSKLGEVIDHDRLCCPFIGHAIVDEPWGGSVWLHLTGSAEARDFIAAELASLLPPRIATAAGLRQ
jgi:hypothetical protein